MRVGLVDHFDRAQSDPLRGGIDCAFPIDQPHGEAVEIGLAQAVGPPEAGIVHHRRDPVLPQARCERHEVPDGRHIGPVARQLQPGLAACLSLDLDGEGQLGPFRRQADDLVPQFRDARRADNV
ncbi:conserved hypothetical protein [Ricinus communis]|uniref:Uncharacterized protein n=1 Tax=Ricinus communis TaxID=3988 RepID=B9TF16_RICCO|nr:conserved hypothetical protein [Ricinus communis]